MSVEALYDAARRRKHDNDYLINPAPLTGCHASTLAAAHRGRTVRPCSSTRPRWQIGHANRLTGAPRHTVPHPPPPRPQRPIRHHAPTMQRAHHAGQNPNKIEQNLTKIEQNPTKKRPKKDQKKTKKRNNITEIRKKTAKNEPRKRHFAEKFHPRKPHFYITSSLFSLQQVVQMAICKCLTINTSTTTANFAHSAAFRRCFQHPRVAPSAAKNPRSENPSPTHFPHPLFDFSAVFFLPLPSPYLRSTFALPSLCLRF